MEAARIPEMNAIESQKSGMARMHATEKSFPVTYPTGITVQLKLPLWGMHIYHAISII